MPLQRGLKSAACAVIKAPAARRTRRTRLSEQHAGKARERETITASESDGPRPIASGVGGRFGKGGARGPKATAVPAAAPAARELDSHAQAATSTALERHLPRGRLDRAGGERWLSSPAPPTRSTTRSPAGRACWRSPPARSAPRSCSPPRPRRPRRRSPARCSTSSLRRSHRVAAARGRAVRVRLPGLLVFACSRTLVRLEPCSGGELVSSLVG